MFGKKGIGGATPPKLHSIIVRRAALAEGCDPYSLTGDVVAFVNHALSEALFERGEVPQEAMQAFHVDYYISQVSNGGHGQFAHNSDWSEPVIADVREGLARLDLPAAAELFGSLASFALVEPARFRQVCAAAGFGAADPFISALDQRFFALCDDLRAALHRWIAGLPCLVALADEQYRDAMTKLGAQNPQLAQRKAGMDKQLADRRDSDPLYQAMRFVCHVTPPGVRFERLLGAHPSPDADDPGVCFRMLTSRGPARLYLYGPKAALWIEGEQKPRGKVPMAMVDAYLARKGLELSDQVKRGEL